MDGDGPAHGRPSAFLMHFFQTAELLEERRDRDGARSRGLPGDGATVVVELPEVVREVAREVEEEEAGRDAPPPDRKRIEGLEARRVEASEGQVDLEARRGDLPQEPLPR